MSDIQDPLIELQRRVQQRQILAMMGINQWVQPASKTVNISDIATASVNQSNTIPSGSEHPSDESLNVEVSKTAFNDTDSANTGSASRRSTGVVDQLTNDYDNNNDYDANSSYISDYDNVNNDADALDIHEQAATEQSPVIYSFDSVTNDAPVASNAHSFHDTPNIEPDQTVATFIDEVVQSTTAPIVQHQFSQSSNNDAGLKKVVPFDLQGGRYGDWVILVDIQALNSDSQKLWKNITQALSITYETASFPICAGMDTAELANASLAGYIFRIGLREEIKVAALTALPEGLHHPNLTTVPTLDEMLADSDSKRQLWEQISH